MSLIRPLSLKPTALVLAIGLMVSAVGLAEFLRPSHFWADHTGEPDYERIVPHHFGDWEEMPYGKRAVVNPVQEESLKRIYSQTFARSYINKRLGRVVMLSIAYGRDQSNDTQLHTPDMCYPSQGFRVDVREDVDVPSPFGAVKATRLLTTLGDDRTEPLTYFIRVGDTVARGSKERNVERIKLALRGFLVDGTLVRVSEVTRKDKAFELQNQFIADLLQALPAHDRGYLIGKRES
jgi:EpsI family protein